MKKGKRKGVTLGVEKGSNCRSEKGVIARLREGQNEEERK